MSRTLSDFLRSEVDFFLQDIQVKWVVPKSEIDSHSSLLKAIHKRFLSLACTATIVGKGARAREFLSALIECTHLLQIYGLRGHHNPVFVMLRQSIELTLKFLYFSLHPVEYRWACDRVDYRDVSFQALIEYIRRTQEHRSLLQGLDIANRIEDIYGECSRHVHVHSSRFMRYQRVSAPVRVDRELLVRLDSLTKQLWPLLIALILAVYPNKYHLSSSLERKLMLNPIRGKLREKLITYLSSTDKVLYR